MLLSEAFQNYDTLVDLEGMAEPACTKAVAMTVSRERSPPVNAQRPRLANNYWHLFLPRYERGNLKITGREHG